MPILRPTSKFLARLDHYNRSDPITAKRIGGAVARFVGTPGAPGLNFEKLGGSNYHSIRVTQGVRIILRRAGADTFDLIDVGPHDIYRRYG